MSDFVPGVDDVIGYALGDVVPGGNLLYNALGPDFAPGINESTGGANMLGNNFAPGINESTGGPNMLGNTPSGFPNIPSSLTNAATNAAKGLVNSLTGSGTGTGSGTSNVTQNFASPFANVTADTTGAAGPAVFNLDPTMGAISMSPTTGAAPQYHAEGGAIKSEYQPQFYSEGGLGNRYVQGDGDGTSDSVPAMLATGEFVIPADVVSALGNGSSDSGASVLDQFLQTIREHKQDHDPKELPPDSLGPLDYLSHAAKKETE